MTIMCDWKGFESCNVFTPALSELFNCGWNSNHARYRLSLSAIVVTCQATSRLCASIARHSILPYVFRVEPPDGQLLGHLLLTLGLPTYQCPDMQLSRGLLLDVNSYGESDSESNNESDGEGQCEAARACKYKPELLWLKCEKASVAVL